MPASYSWRASPLTPHTCTDGSSATNKLLVTSCINTMRAFVFLCCFCLTEATSTCPITGFLIFENKSLVFKERCDELTSTMLQYTKRLT